ncbi:MAG: hypothetical protein IJL06_01745 [Kiritimatiellae bacterium]|nr:hypothetical protein [Kiritimatiellia bacterium]
MNARTLLPAALAAAALLAGGCRTAGPYERHFRPTAAVVPAAATAVVSPDGSTNAPVVVAVPSTQVAEATWEVPDDAVLDPATIVRAELASLAEEANWLAAGWAEIGRSEFVTTYVPSRDEAISFAARLGAPGVLFYTEDLGSHWVWRTEWEPRRVYHYAPPPPPPPGPHAHRHHRPPPPVLVSHVEEVPVERLRLVRYFRNLAIFLRAASQPPVAAP